MKKYKFDDILQDQYNFCFIKRYPFTIHSMKLQEEFVKVTKFTIPNWKVDTDGCISSVTLPCLGSCEYGKMHCSNCDSLLYNNKLLNIVQKMLGIKVSINSRDPSAMLCHQDLIIKMKSNLQFRDRYRLLQFNYQHVLSQKLKARSILSRFCESIAQSDVPRLNNLMAVYLRKGL